ncbi:MAG: alpha,alpha-trehalose-phosphate synthase (UDP-forming) [Acetobacteraceae bacterium]
MSRLVIVSNRVPLPADRRPRAGGLAVALGDALVPGSLWFGWSGRRSARSDGPPVIAEAGGVTYATVDLSEAEYRLFYAGFANGALWPLLHYRIGLMDYHREEWEAYRAVNRRFAQALVSLLQPDDLLWVHDYHLIPLGAELRALGVRNRIGFFLHTPWMAPEVAEVLPPVTALLSDFCAYDVVGFHTARYRAAFIDCLNRLLGVVSDHDGLIVWRGRTIRAVVDPIGIDADSFAVMAAESARGAEARRMKLSLAGRTLAIGADRLDYSKGLPHRVEAFGRLLGRYPVHRRRVSFLQIAARSREDVASYQNLRQELDRLVGDINGQYSEFDWTPVRYMTRTVGRRTLAGFYRIARVGVVTPLRDGMNLVAKEFIAAQDPDDPGVLILSRFAGAADELTDALIVNPFDSDEISEAMHEAVTMGLAQRRMRHVRLREAVQASTARRYCERFLRHLAPGGSDRPSAATPEPVAAAAAIW